MFLVYKMETFKHCKEVKHIMILIEYDFLSYVISDQQLKITFRKSSGPPEKIHSPLKIQKVQFLLTLNIFQDPRKGGDTVLEVVIAIEIMSELHSNLEQKVNHNILKDFFSRTEPFIFTSIAPVLLEWSNKMS